MQFFLQSSLALSLLLSAASAFADTSAGWSCDVKVGVGYETKTTHLDLFPTPSAYPSRTNQRIDNEYFAKFDVSVIDGANGQYYTNLFVSVFKRRVVGDERIVTTRANYQGPFQESFDNINPSNLFLVFNPASVAIECKPGFRR